MVLTRSLYTCLASHGYVLTFLSSDRVLSRTTFGILSGRGQAVAEAAQLEGSISSMAFRVLPTCEVLHRSERTLFTRLERGTDWRV